MSKHGHQAAAAIRKLEILKRDFRMKGANFTTMERAIDVIRLLARCDQEAEISVLQNALSALLDAYVVMADGLEWRWDPEHDDEVKHARAVLEATGFQRREIKPDA